MAEEHAIEKVLELDEDVEIVDFYHEGLGEIPELEGLYQLRELRLRSNAIYRVTNLQSLGKTLTHLDLYDNQITKIEKLEGLEHLQ